MGMPEFHFYNDFHIGDAIMIFRFLWSIRQLILSKDVHITFHYSEYNQQYMRELQRYEDISFLTMKPISEKPYNAIRLWIGDDIDGVHPHNYEIYHEKYHNKIRTILGLESEVINCGLFLNEPYLDDIYSALSDKYKDIDIIVVNSLAYSGQFKRNLDELNNLARELSRTYKVVTTSKVDGIACTIDDGLALQDISAVTGHAKYVIAVQTAPLCAMYTTTARNSVKKWFILTTNGHHYVHRTIDYTMITDGDLAKVYAYFHSINSHSSSNDS